MNLQGLSRVLCSALRSWDMSALPANEPSFTGAMPSVSSGFLSRRTESPKAWRHQVLAALAAARELRSS